MRRIRAKLISRDGLTKTVLTRPGIRTIQTYARIQIPVLSEDSALPTMPVAEFRYYCRTGEREGRMWIFREQ